MQIWNLIESSLERVFELATGFRHLPYRYVVLCGSFNFSVVLSLLSMSSDFLIIISILRLLERAEGSSFLGSWHFAKPAEASLLYMDIAEAVSERKSVTHIS